MSSAFNWCSITVLARRTYLLFHSSKIVFISPDLIFNRNAFQNWASHLDHLKRIYTGSGEECLLFDGAYLASWSTDQMLIKTPGHQSKSSASFPPSSFSVVKHPYLTWSIDNWKSRWRNEAITFLYTNWAQFHCTTTIGSSCALQAPYWKNLTTLEVETSCPS